MRQKKILESFIMILWRLKWNINIEIQNIYNIDYILSDDYIEGSKLNSIIWLRVF